MSHVWPCSLPSCFSRSHLLFPSASGHTSRLSPFKCPMYDHAHCPHAFLVLVFFFPQQVAIHQGFLLLSVPCMTMPTALMLFSCSFQEMPNGHAGNWTQGLPHAEQVRYHYTKHPMLTRAHGGHITEASSCFTFGLVVFSAAMLCGAAASWTRSPCNLFLLFCFLWLGGRAKQCRCSLLLRAAVQVRPAIKRDSVETPSTPFAF